MRLQVTKLGKLLPAVVQAADKRFRLLVRNFVCTDVATLGKPLLADVTGVWLLSRVATLVCLSLRSVSKIAQQEKDLAMLDVP